MRRGLKVLIISLIVTIIMIGASAGTVLAAGLNSGDCPNPDCPNADCPNPDCPSDDNGPMYQHGNGPQCQYRSGQD